MSVQGEVQIDHQSLGGGQSGKKPIFFLCVAVAVIALCFVSYVAGCRAGIERGSAPIMKGLAVTIYDVEKRNPSARDLLGRIATVDVQTALRDLATKHGSVEEYEIARYHVGPVGLPIEVTMRVRRRDGWHEEVLVCHSLRSFAELWSVAR